MQTLPGRSPVTPRGQRKRKREGDDSSTGSQDQLPSPSPTRLKRDASSGSKAPATATCVSKPHEAHQSRYTDPHKRSQSCPDRALDRKLSWWLSTLPGEGDPLTKVPAVSINDMSRPPSKRSRSSDAIEEATTQSGDGSDIPFSRGRKYLLYQSPSYPAALESKGSHMRTSESDMAQQDWELCKRLLVTEQTIGEDAFFNRHLDRFLVNLRARSKARIYTDLHPRLVPSVENLYISGRADFEPFIEGYNDPWIKSIPFYGPRAQPDHTFGFKLSSFSDTERRKLQIDPMQKSYYTAREDIYFPFLTAEVKCGTQGLILAERPNMHSMTIAMRGVVDLYRRAGRPAEIHRRLLGFTISHNDSAVRIHAYYPEIDGDRTTYWRKDVAEILIANDDGKHKWTSYQFTINVCEMFALPLLQRLKEVINALSDPASQPVGSTADAQDYSAQSFQDDTILPASRAAALWRSSAAAGLGAGLRSTVQILQQQLQQQAERAEEREKMLARELQELRETMKEQRK